MNTRLESLPPYASSRIIPIGRTSDGQSHYIVAEVPMGGGVTGETDGEKLARLFCASPDMLGAMKTALAMLSMPVQTSGNASKATVAILRADCSGARDVLSRAIKSADPSF